jgi:hypothetical protein
MLHGRSLFLFLLGFHKDFAFVAHVPFAVREGMVENMGFASGLALGDGRHGSPVVRPAGAGTLLRMFISRIWHRY